MEELKVRDKNLNIEETWNLLNKYSELKIILDSIPAIICLKDTNNIIVKSNNFLAKIIGIKIEEIEGKSCEQLFPDEAGHYYKDDREVIDSKKPKMGIVEKVKNSNGEYKWVQTDKIPIFNEEQKVKGVLIFSIDITEQKENEERMNRMTQELTRSNEELQQFAYFASHDLQEPLRIISSYVQLLQEKISENIDEKSNEHMNNILISADKMKNLIFDLLDFAKVNKNGKGNKIIDINDIIEEEIKIFPNFKKNDITVFYENLPKLNIDKIKIKQLFHNLMSNAIKFKKGDNVTIEITAAELDNYWKFKVKDDGIGIDPIYFKRIFGLFKRLYTDEEYRGTGIGLAICKKIVEYYGGEIWVTSGKDLGATFYFTLYKDKLS